MNDNYKNLIVGFTTDTEWKESKIDHLTEKLLNAITTKANPGSQYFNLCMIIIVFPDKSLLECKLCQSTV